ncbi:MAG: carboxypeptidase-like regulatory domain-containing protein, partial [Bacteroidota bacterium]
MKRSLFSVLALLCLTISGFAQTPHQTIRGTVRDVDTQQALAGATVTLRDGATVLKGAITDAEGSFRFTEVPIGRHSIQVAFTGYEAAFLEQLMLTSGKEMVLEIPLTESMTEAALEDVVITDEASTGDPINEMATLSARSFSVEETKRYAAAVFDPARMAQNFAGVMSSGFDMENEIVIRGNSPRYMLWRLEGIEIPNPNHFGGMGSSGGPISMLSSSTLGNSDFYTGAFPAEFGNALSGVFDLRFRRGNNEQREFSFMVGALGIEASAEGYFSKKSRASYLINYRYSTLA